MSRLVVIGNSAVAVVLASHGSSSHERINRPMFELAEKIASKLDVFVTPAFLDGQPDVRSIANEIYQSQIVVIPFMASNGYYTDVVFKKAFSKTICGEKQVHMSPAIGTYSELVGLVETRIEKLTAAYSASELKESTFVVVGHGTRKNKNSCRSTIDLVKSLRGRRPALEIQFAFIDQNPSVGHIIQRIQTRNVVVLPFMMGLGPHVTQDIPNAFGVTDFDQVVFKDEFEFPFEQKVVGRIGRIENVVCDQPIGNYSELSDLCVSIAKKRLQSNERNNEHHKEVV